MNNKKLGIAFEKLLCELLAKKGYWVHFIEPKKDGSQPFDVIAVKDDVPIAIDCKTLSDKINWFRFERLEYNQIMAFDKWMLCGNKTAMIAVLWKNAIYFIQYYDLITQHRIDMRTLEGFEIDEETRQKYNL